MKKIACRIIYNNVLALFLAGSLQPWDLGPFCGDVLLDASGISGSALSCPRRVSDPWRLSPRRFVNAWCPIAALQ